MARMLVRSPRLVPARNTSSGNLICSQNISNSVRSRVAYWTKHKKFRRKFKVYVACSCSPLPSLHRSRCQDVWFHAPDCETKAGEAGEEEDSRRNWQMNWNEKCLSCACAYFCELDKSVLRDNKRFLSSPESRSVLCFIRDANKVRNWIRCKSSTPNRVRSYVKAGKHSECDNLNDHCWRRTPNKGIRAPRHGFVGSENDESECKAGDESFFVFYQTSRVQCTLLAPANCREAFGSIKQYSETPRCNMQQPT